MSKKINYLKYYNKLILKSNKYKEEIELCFIQKQYCADMVRENLEKLSKYNLEIKYLNIIVFDEICNIWIDDDSKKILYSIKKQRSADTIDQDLFLLKHLKTLLSNESLYLVLKNKINGTELEKKRIKLLEKLLNIQKIILVLSNMKDSNWEYKEFNDGILCINGFDKNNQPKFCYSQTDSFCYSADQVYHRILISEVYRKIKNQNYIDFNIGIPLISRFKKIIPIKYVRKYIIHYLSPETIKFSVPGYDNIFDMRTNEFLGSIENHKDKIVTREDKLKKILKQKN